MRCLSSCSYIKPQRCGRRSAKKKVVYYLVPTSNHNPFSEYSLTKGVVYHLVPTSNHNLAVVVKAVNLVVYHLVPTSNHNQAAVSWANSRVVYHLVPTSNHNNEEEYRLVLCVVYHLVPTSNHNREFDTSMYSELFIILFLHQTTTVGINPSVKDSCLSSCSYIKPQPQHLPMFYRCVVYHLVPTSNHNYRVHQAVKLCVVYHLVPTSNHNRASALR